MKMVEKVARAICVSMEAEPTNWLIYQDEARAAIEAMRKPSKAVEEAIDKSCNFTHGEGKRLWEAAIDAAVAEKG